MAKADGHIGQLLVAHAWEHGFIVFVLAMVSAEFMQLVKAWVLPVPFYKPLAFEIIVKVFEQFEVAAAGDTEQLQLAFCRGLSIAAALSNILFGTAGSLHHLIYCAVAVGGEKTLTEMLCQLVEDIAPLEEAQLSIHHRFL